jgi:protein-L-isoaspartate(D-aspartate) O-methyltransferase
MTGDYEFDPAERAAKVAAMVDRVADAVSDPRVLEAMRVIPRDAFVPPQMRRYAFEDAALGIGEDQTISQPLIVGVMTEALRLQGHEHVLEVGTGSGYQAAILARLAGDVVSVEIIDTLRERARATLEALGIENVRVLAASAVVGAPEEGPYDAILVTAAAPAVPDPLVDQLRVGGRLVIPVGSESEQDLLLLSRTAEGVRRTSLGGVRFVPLRGPSGFAGSPGVSWFE